MSYHSDYMRKRYWARRREAFGILGGKCVSCGSKKQLQTDHKDRKKKAFDGTRMTSVSRKKFLIEIKKCQLLCQKCHTLKTIMELGQKVAKGKHGTLSSYRYCHCEKCKKAKRDWWHKNKKKYNKNRREKRKASPASPTINFTNI